MTTKQQNIETHLTILEQSKALFDRGLRRDSEFSWVEFCGKIGLKTEKERKELLIMRVVQPYWGAYLLSELMEMLPDGTKLIKENTVYLCELPNIWQVEDKNPITCVVSMLLYLNDNKIINLSEL